MPPACRPDAVPVGAAGIPKAGLARRRRLTAVLLLFPLVVAAATLPARPAWADEVAARVRQEPLHAAAACTGRFVRHSLPHTTRAADRPARAYDTNGAGVALADLDGDRLIDIVLAGLHAPVTLLWNRGGLRFERVELAEAGTRAVAAVDVDGNGDLDLAFTRSGAGPALWRGSGPARAFERPHPLWPAPMPIYAMAWADLDGDLDLDLAGATYDDELRQSDAGQADSGVFVYENTGRALLPVRLSRNAQGLAVLLTDLNGDGRPDIVVGNDFALRDGVYYRTPDGWQAGEPFARTTRNTMSFAAGDVDNDGTLELLAADMKPYLSGPEVDAAWRPLRVAEAERLAKMAAITGEELAPDPRQVEANTLQVRGAGGAFAERGEWAGIAATGWTWSAQFGDLDNDGFLDLYAVNGMIAAEIFGHLPGAELVEQNQALRNDGQRALRPRAGVGTRRHRERARHGVRRPGPGRRPGHRRQQPGGAGAAVREPAVRRRRPGGGPALARLPQPARHRRRRPARHRHRHLPAHRAGRQRLPVQRPRAPPLRAARRRGGPPHPHRHLARPRRHPGRRTPPPHPGHHRALTHALPQGSAHRATRPQRG